MADDCDRAQELAQQDLERALKRRQAETVLGSSTGACNACGDKIEPARLSAVPQAQHCLDCAVELEGKRGSPWT